MPKLTLWYPFVIDSRPEVRSGLGGLATGLAGPGLAGMLFCKPRHPESAEHSGSVSSSALTHEGYLAHTPQNARHMAGKSAEKDKGKKCISNSVGSM